MLSASNPISPKLSFEGLGACFAFLDLESSKTVRTSEDIAFVEVQANGVSIIAQFGADGSLLQVFIDGEVDHEAGWWTLSNC